MEFSDGLEQSAVQTKDAEVCDFYFIFIVLATIQAFLSGTGNRKRE